MWPPIESHITSCQLTVVRRVQVQEFHYQIYRYKIFPGEPSIPPFPNTCVGRVKKMKAIYLYLILIQCVSLLHLGALMGQESTFHLAYPLSSFVKSFGLLCWFVLWLLWLPAPADGLSWVPVGQALLLSVIAVSRALFLRLPTGQICAVGPSGQDL